MSQNKIKEWAKGHKILTTIIIIFIIAIVGSAMGGEENTSTPVSESNEQETITKTEPVKEKVWTSVFKTSATSDKQTEGFDLQGGQQKIIYKNTGGETALCIVYVMREGSTIETDGGIPTIMIDGDQEDETMMRKSKGQYYVDLKTVNGTCEIEIQELR